MQAFIQRNFDEQALTNLFSALHAAHEAGVELTPNNSGRMIIEGWDKAEMMNDVGFHFDRRSIFLGTMQMFELKPGFGPSLKLNIDTILGDNPTIQLHRIATEVRGEDILSEALKAMLIKAATTHGAGAMMSEINRLMVDNKVPVDAVTA